MATLLEYLFTGSTAGPTTQAAGVTGGNVTNGSLSTFSISTGDGWASVPVVSGNGASSATTAAKAVTYNSYFYWSVTPDAGKTLNLTLLHFHAGRGGTTTPRGIKVRSSLDSYAGDLYSATVDTATPTWSDISIDLSGAGYQGLSSAFTFRFYIWTPTTSNAVDVDEIRLEGTISSASALSGKNGLAVASIKSVNGLAIASVGKVNGV